MAATEKAFQIDKERRLKQMAEARDVIDGIEINFEAEKQLTEANKELAELKTQRKTAEAEKVRWQTAIPQFEKEIEAVEVLEREQAAIAAKKAGCATR